jgi:phospholipase/carboxylesterase
VVALHGGYGHGRNFLWTWLREARSRGFLLLAPTSRASTWAFDAPAAETAALASMLDFVRERWNVDATRVLLTGLSDGATFTLLAGLAEGSPYSALAPVSGVLHPLAHRLGHLARARGRRIYLVHGARDWLFPVSLARLAREALEAGGADLHYREIGDLSHAYPREENAAILRWFDPGLASD